MNHVTTESTESHKIQENQTRLWHASRCVDQVMWNKELKHKLRAVREEDIMGGRLIHLVQMKQIRVRLLGSISRSSKKKYRH